MIYKNIPNVKDHYFAGDDGFIYSERSGTMKRMKGCFCSKKNYLHLNLRFKDGKRKCYLVHIAVCSAFHGEKPDPKSQVRHLDGNSLNNRPDNLAWASAKQNHSDKIVHGTDDNGLKNSRAKLSKEKLFIIRWLLENTILTHETIGKLLGESRGMISKVSSKSRYARSNVKVVEF